MLGGLDWVGSVELKCLDCIGGRHRNGMVITGHGVGVMTDDWIYDFLMGVYILVLYLLEWPPTYVVFGACDGTTAFCRSVCLFTHVNAMGCFSNKRGSR